MENLSERLKTGAVVLAQLELKRNQNAMTQDDYDEEYGILVTELWDLEEDILSDPGALEPHLIRVRPRCD